MAADPEMSTLPTMASDSIRQIQDHLRRHADRAVPLAELAALTGLSPGHLQRRFTAVVGCSPKAFHRACREELLRAALRRGEGVAGAIYAAGYGSGSRVYERAGQRLGMTPGQYARGGAGVAVSWAAAPTDLGEVLIAATDQGVCFVALGDSAEDLLLELQGEFPAASFTPMPAGGESALAAWLAVAIGVVTGDALGDMPPLAPRGTEFQLRVWECLRTIPEGQTWTYGQLAAALGQPSAVRAVARACATNPISLLVPCHRVIRNGGALAGYRWGLERKAALIAREKSRR